MSYAFMPNPVAVQHEGTVIFHVFKEYMERGAVEDYFFSTSEYAASGEPSVFDVRLQPGYDDHMDVKDNLKSMVRAGYIR